MLLVLTQVCKGFTRFYSQYNKGGLGGGDAENLEERQRRHVVAGSAAGIREPRQGDTGSR